MCTNAANCGTLTPLHTASGAAATYTPPQAISGNSQNVTIEAFATADHTKNVVTSMAVTGFASSLKGTYVFETKGEDANGAFQLAGVVVLDGNGGITSGEQTHSDPVVSLSDPITGGSYNIGPDGRGTLTINTADQNIGQQGIENFCLVFLNSSSALIATLDNPDPKLQRSFETSSGTLDLQTSTAAPSGGYAFAANGVDVNNAAMAIAGVLNIDSPNTISGAGSVADQDDAGSVSPNASLSGTLTSPDRLGSLQLNLTTGFAPSLQFTGYIVDATHIKLIESDMTGTGAGFGSTAGVAIGQGAATGKFTHDSTFAGSYVLGILGQDPSGTPNSLAWASRFTADTSGNLKSGYADEVLSVSGVEISDSFTGTYTLGPPGTGRVDSHINFSSNGPGPELIFYLTGNGNPPLVLDADDNGGSLAFASLGIGTAHPQAAPPFSFNGKYGLEFTQSSSVSENNATGQVTVNGSSNTLAGVVDTNLGFSPQPDTPLSGTFLNIPNGGHFNGTLTNTFFPTPASSANTISVAFYLVDPGQVLFIETDLLLSGEASFGSFSARTPVCAGCP